MPEMVSRRPQAGPRVAIALASFNGSRYIRQQIESLLWQRDCRVTVYIRDDRSTDETLQQIASVAKDAPGQVVVVDPGGAASGSAAQNFFLLILALRHEHFDYLALSDQDDIWEESKLARAIQQLETRQADGYSSNLIAFSTDGTPPSIIRKDHSASRFDYLFQTASAGCTYVLTAALFGTVVKQLERNVPNRDIAHDILIYAIARSHGFEWVRDSAAHILYRQHGENVVGARAGLGGLLARWQLVRQGWYRQQTKELAGYLAGSDEETRLVAATSRANLRDRIWLASRALWCRRRLREALAFAALQFVP